MVTPFAGEGPLFVTATVYVTVSPTFAVVGFAVFVTTRSFPVTAVVTLDVLLLVFESFPLGPTSAVFLTVPIEVALTTIVTVALASLARDPIVQVTVALPLHVPWVVADDTWFTPAGSASVKVTPVAVAGPLLLTSIE